MHKDIGKEMVPKMVTLGAIGRISLDVSEENQEAKHAAERDLTKYYLFAVNEEITSNFRGTYHYMRNELRHLRSISFLCQQFKTKPMLK